MHVAALTGQSAIIRLLVQTIKRIDFIRRLYINDTEEQTRQRIQFILDMYMNTPDKMVTPIVVAILDIVVLFSSKTKRLFISHRNSDTTMQYAFYSMNPAVVEMQ